MDIKLFDFNLPKNLIAQESIYPLDSSKLLLIDGQKITDTTTNKLPQILSEGDLIVVNNTRVIKSKISALVNQKKYDFTFLNEHEVSIWKALAKGSKKLNINEELHFYGGLKGIIKDKNSEGEIFIDINLRKNEFILYLNTYGALPLPPYISDPENKNIHYQTLFAKADGAVAAPTAGLHFTKQLKNNLQNKGINLEEITLHVGAGTFLPVKENNINSHKMHNEYIEVSAETAKKINTTKDSGRNVIAIGTTVLRALESCADEKGYISEYIGNTDIYITPGYNIKSVDYLFTNFHLPKSTLFILVCSFAGISNMQNAYKYAIDNNYRFYSLGDACLIKSNK